MNSKKWVDLVTSIAAYTGRTVREVGEMTFMEASVWVARMRAEGVSWGT
jgi:hypothetical protein